MLHKKLFNMIPSCVIATTLCISLGFAAVAQAADSRFEIKPDSKPQHTQPESQPPKPAPSQPSSGTEPVDGDDTALV